MVLMKLGLITNKRCIGFGGIKMSWNVSFGISGRACCRICEKVITKEQLQVNFSSGGGYRTVEQSVHLDCLDRLGDDAVAKRG
ncbi:hypothetical protein LCGC14_0814450 [marine sediment metagenome]|uniref:PARP-type domain-containing protein n=1 Tax=marine sediment metagenome TaxID=412755 RepID=A0A0F9Q5Z0_9ZZZZ